MNERAPEHHAEHTARALQEQLEMPENHLDTVVTPNSIDATKKASLRTALIAVIALPLFLLTGFTIAYTSAQAAPVPHDMAITIAGPVATTQQYASAITEQTGSAFDITQTTDIDAARNAVSDRTAVGAIIIDGSNVDTIIASAGGRIAVAPVEQVGQQIATQLGGTATITDVAPVTSEDTSGTALFYYILVCTVAGYLSITVISQVLPKARARTMMLVTSIASILAPIIAFGMISIFVGDFGATFGSIAAVIGIGMIYTFTVGTLATLFTKLLGQAAIFAVLVVMMFLNFPSTGGSAPESMMPGFWQAIHNTWLGSGGFEAMRSIVYFSGHQTGRWLLQLGIWAVSALMALIAVSIVKSRRKAKADAPVTATVPAMPAASGSAVTVSAAATAG